MTLFDSNYCVMSVDLGAYDWEANRDKSEVPLLEEQLSENKLNKPKVKNVINYDNGQEYPLVVYCSCNLVMQRLSFTKTYRSHVLKKIPKYLKIKNLLVWQNVCLFSPLWNQLINRYLLKKTRKIM